MKRIISIALVILTLSLCLCSCGKAELTYGEYEAELNAETSIQPYLRIIPDGRAAFGYKGAHDRTIRATYTYNEEANLITVSIGKSGGVLVFEIKEDKLVFTQEGSSGIQEFNGIPGITDGQELLVKTTYAY